MVFLVYNNIVKEASQSGIKRITEIGSKAISQSGKITSAGLNSASTCLVFLASSSFMTATGMGNAVRAGLQTASESAAFKDATDKIGKGLHTASATATTAIGSGLSSATDMSLKAVTIIGTGLKTATETGINITGTGVSKLQDYRHIVGANVKAATSQEALQNHVASIGTGIKIVFDVGVRSRKVVGAGLYSVADAGWKAADQIGIRMKSAVGSNSQFFGMSPDSVHDQVNLVENTLNADDEIETVHTSVEHATGVNENLENMEITLFPTLAETDSSNFRGFVNAIKENNLKAAAAAAGVGIAGITILPLASMATAGVAAAPAVAAVTPAAAGTLGAISAAGATFLNTAIASGATKIVLISATKIAVGAGIAAVAPAVALPVIGFTSAGVAAGSIAAVIHSTIGCVAAGSTFALLQSAGVLGFASTTTAALGTLGGVVALIV